MTRPADEFAPVRFGPRGYALSLAWLLRLRWIAVLGVFAAAIFARTYALVPRPLPLCLTALGLGLFNLILWLRHRHRGPDAKLERSEFRRSVMLQVCVDLAALTLLLYWSGGAENPFATFYVFHIAISAMLLPLRLSSLMGLAACGLYFALLVAEHVAVVPIHPLVFGPSGAESSHGGGRHALAFDLLAMLAFALALFGVIYFIQALVRQQRRTERARRQHERVAVSRERLARVGEISAGLAHSIRNPLHGALNCADLLRDAAGEPPDPETLDLLSEGLRRIESVTNRLLVLTREAPLRRVRCDLGAQVRDTLRFIRARSTAGVTVHEEIGVLPEVAIDPDRFHEALFNIVDNAVDACAEAGGGEVRVRAESAGDRVPGVVLAVRDSGIGIEAERLDKVFDPFFTTKPIGQGSGLGLAIARRVVEEHGGMLEIESCPGRGTEVRIHLPAERVQTVGEFTR